MFAWTALSQTYVITFHALIYVYMYSQPYYPVANMSPGELGRAVLIDKDKLSPEERRKYDEGWENNQFNQYVSDMISLHRTLPDIRDER